MDRCFRYSGESHGQIDTDNDYDDNDPGNRISGNDDYSYDDYRENGDEGDDDSPDPDSGLGEDDDDHSETKSIDPNVNLTWEENGRKYHKYDKEGTRMQVPSVCWTNMGLTCKFYIGQPPSAPDDAVCMDLTCAMSFSILKFPAHTAWWIACSPKEEASYASHSSPQLQLNQSYIGFPGHVEQDDGAGYIAP
ncbi:hypothetical protein HC256_006663 [Beauveria bassiana]|nr:hypothetical protein HC256_006663 [Beauveria bassiana]